MISQQSYIEEPATWKKYNAKLCRSCQASCCTLPVEVTPDDLIRMDLMDEFERGEPMKKIAKRLKKQGVIEHFSQKSKLFTISRLANGACIYLNQETQRCTIYPNRPDTCRNHPRIGPRSGYCAYNRKVA